MEYADSSEQASIFAEKALEEMRARGLTQHPNNYTLWYTFVSEAIPDLTLAITSLDKKQEPVSEHHCAELHQKFFHGQGRSRRCRRVLKLSNQMTTVLGDITAAGEDADVHIDELGTVLESLSNNERVVEAKTAISSAIEITRDISEKILSSKSAFDGLVLRLSDYVEIWRSFVWKLIPMASQVLRTAKALIKCSSSQRSMRCKMAHHYV